MNKKLTYEENDKKELNRPLINNEGIDEREDSTTQWKESNFRR